MQIKAFAPKYVKGKVILPSSKSLSNRVLVINALSGNRGMLPENVSDCDDTRVMIKWLDGCDETVDVGAAGTAMRFSTALLAVSEGYRVITGSERMKQRPIALLVDALRGLGAEIEYVGNEGYPPLRIKGNPTMKGGCVSLSGGVSSQYISALLMIAPMMEEGLTLTLTGDVVSRPYIDMTIGLMRDFGAKVMWMDDNVVRVEPRVYSKRDFFVESDWSACSYWYEMVALGDGDVLLPGLFKDSFQGDSRVAELFSMLGVATEYVDGEGMGACVHIYRTGDVCGRLDLDLVEQPDLAQTLVVCCCMMGVPFRFTGLQSLKIKETDRINALRTEMRKLGYVVGEENDSVLYWNGERCEADTEPVIDTYDDHRMAMAFAPCALKLGEIRINDPHVVSKSYPGYWEDLRSVGFVCE
jgi:3-phosphoshikimate 1-carboxyvinyltransferase